jgi:hypothetical protein
LVIDRDRFGSRLVSEKDVVSEDILHSTPARGREIDAVVWKCNGTVLKDEVGMVEKYILSDACILLFKFLHVQFINFAPFTCHLSIGEKKKQMLNWHNAHGGRFRMHRFFLSLKVNGGSI